MYGGDSVLLEDWLRQWLACWCGNLRQTTQASYRDCVRLYILPLLGKTALEALTADEIMLALQMIAEQGHGRTAELCLDVLRSALRTAKELRKIDYSPADACFPPRFARRTVKPLSDEELPVFVNAACKQPLWPLIACMLYGGLRRGEALALRWGDVDLESGDIRIERQVCDAGGRLVVGPPKSDAGRRYVPICPELADVLREHRRRQLRKGLAGKEVPLCCTMDGGMITPAGLYSAFRRIGRKVGFHVHPHRLRHTAATRYLEAGVDVKACQYVLGHSSCMLTLDVYCASRYNHVRANFSRCGLAI